MNEDSSQGLTCRIGYCRLLSLGRRALSITANARAFAPFSRPAPRATTCHRRSTGQYAGDRADIRLRARAHLPRRTCPVRSDALIDRAVVLAAKVPRPSGARRGAGRRERGDRTRPSVAREAAEIATPTGTSVRTGAAAIAPASSTSRGRYKAEPDPSGRGVKLLGYATGAERPPEASPPSRSTRRSTPRSPTPPTRWARR